MTPLAVVSWFGILSTPSSGVKSEPRRSGTIEPMRDWPPGTVQRVVGLGLLAVLVGVVTIVQGTANIVVAPTDSDLLVFFLPAAQRIVEGTPFHVYDVHASNGALLEVTPLSFWWMAIPLGLGQALGIGQVESCVAAAFGTLDCRTVVWMVGLAFLPFVLLLGAVGVLAARLVNPALRRDDALLAGALIVLSPLLWLAYTEWWHPEQVLMLLLVVAGAWQLQRRRSVSAGVLFGLAMLTRPTALGPIAALLTLVLVERSWRRLVTVAATAGIVVGLGMLPYLLVDGRQTFEALFTYRGEISVGNSIWAFVRGVPILGELIRAYDRWIVLAVTVVMALLAGRWRGVTSNGAGAWGVMAIALMLVTLLGKRTWPYYYAEALVFLVIWEVAARSGGLQRGWRWPSLTVLYLLVTATLAQYMGLQSISDGGPVLRMMVVAQFVGIGVVAVGVWRALRDSPESEESSGAIGNPEVAPASTV
jgi:glycosyl transferase family 87